MVLNPELYRRLEEVFGEVRVANEDVTATFVRGWQAPAANRLGQEREDWHTARQRQVEQVITRGEQFRIKCPRCGDTRFRLYISYLWDRKPLAIYCQNEHCHRDKEFLKELRRKVLHTEGKVAFAAPPAQLAERAVVAPVEPPGRIVLLSSLPVEHPARLYVEQRGYDADQLSQEFKIGYCERVNDRRHFLLQGRLYIPIELGGVLVGWQGRFLGERTWSTCPVPKYFNLPEMAKRFLLYNEDQAAKQLDVVVVEGVTAVWRLGPPAVALLGKTLSGPQIQRLVGRRGGGLVILLLDGDAASELATAAAQLQPALGEQVVSLSVPAGFDPGECDRDFLWAFIRRRVEEAGRKLSVTPKL